MIVIITAILSWVCIKLYRDRPPPATYIVRGKVYFNPNGWGEPITCPKVRGKFYLGY